MILILYRETGDGSKFTRSKVGYSVVNARVIDSPKIERGHTTMATKEIRKRITEEVQTTTAVEKLRNLANLLEKEDGKRGVNVGKQGWENLIDAVALAQIVGEYVKDFGKEAVRTMQEYVPFAVDCSTKHLYGDEWDCEIKQETEISKDFEKEEAIKSLLYLHGISTRGIEEMLTVLSISVKKISDLDSADVCAPVVAVLKDKGYAIVNKAEVTISKPKIRSKRSSGAKAVATSHNKDSVVEANQKVAEV